jgi:hypothetical protein
MTEGPDGIHLVPSASRVLADDVLRVFPDEICVCDFYIEGVETGREVSGGYRLGRILSIDHHAPVTRFARAVSSANLALAHVAGHGRFDGPVVINHTDCDSILSAGIMSGLLDPLEEFGLAAIAADHTGAEHPIADLLQALDAHRDPHLSYASLAQLRAGHVLHPVAARALDRRRRMRERAGRLVDDGAVMLDRGVAFARLDEAIGGELIVPLLPDAALLVLASRMRESSRWEIKVRRGQAAPPHLTLSALGLEKSDPGYGGRWNAGSNRRAGGTDIAPEVYVEDVRQRVQPFLRSVER